MNKKSLATLIEFFALCGVVAFLCGFADPWAFIACMVFGVASAVTKLFYNVAKE